MKRYFRDTAIVCLLGALLLTAGPTRAGAETDTGSTFPVQPIPADCQVAARPIDDLIEILTGGNAGVSLAETPDEETLPLGYPAGIERAGEVTATIIEIVACLNAGDIPRATALFTDDGLRRFMGPWTAEGTWTEAEVREMVAMTGPLAEDEWQTLLGVANVSTLTDGRLTALAMIDDPFEVSGQPQALFLYFARQDGRWLIDDFSELSKV
jgi:hypothetical protein